MYVCCLCACESSLPIVSTPSLNCGSETVPRLAQCFHPYAQVQLFRNSTMPRCAICLQLPERLPFSKPEKEVNVGFRHDVLRTWVGPEFIILLIKGSFQEFKHWPHVNRREIQMRAIYRSHVAGSSIRAVV